MKKLYDKDEVLFSLVWIGLYVVGMNLALQVCGGFDHLAEKSAVSLLAPVGVGAALAAASTAWIIRHGLADKLGLGKFRGSGKAFLYFLPLIAVSCVNLGNGLGLSASPAVVLLMAANMALAGYVEEIIFRGFLFHGMARGNLRSAVIVSAVTFGAGHIVNLGNTEDHLGVILQVCYAIAIGLMYTMIVYKGRSLWPCVVSHMFVNASSVFALDNGLLTDLAVAAFGQAGPTVLEIAIAAAMILISGGYALWLWKKAPCAA